MVLLMMLELINYGFVFNVDIAAYPDSVNVLDGTSNDVRTPDKLIDDVNDTVDGTHMWVAPILPGIVSTFIMYT